MLRSAIFLTFLILVHSQEPIVETNYGRIRGDVRELDGKEYTVFMGIPFAAPPVGELRFRPPQMLEGWGGDVLDALEAPPACPQHPFKRFSLEAAPQQYFQLTESEDCLFLNIYVTGDVSRVQRGSLPVIVFIHGGAFVVGSANFQIGDAFVTDADPVVMVAIQYRLGTLGFLSSGDDALSGNLGLKDQTFALRWVQENIANFGGDPDQVTIAGESAGGQSVLAHMISPMSAGLFHKASAQSAAESWLYPKKEVAGMYFRRLADALDCAGSSELILDCLRTKSWQDIKAVQEVSTDALSARVIDGEFITDEPRKLWAEGAFNDAELMVGFTGDDGSFLIDVNFFPFDFVSNRSRDLEIINKMSSFLLNIHLSDDSFQESGEITRYGQPLINHADLRTVVKARYYDSAKEQLQKARGIIDSIRDSYFGVFSLFAANQVAERNGKAYVYVFNHRTSILRPNVPGHVELKAPHGGELTYQFGYGLTDPADTALTQDEIALTHSVIRAWTSFATGDSSYLSMSGEVIEWPRYTTDEKNVLIFDTEMSTESVEDGAVTWQPALDFWLAIDSLAQFEKDDKEPKPYPPIGAASCLWPSTLLILSVAGRTFLA